MQEATWCDGRGRSWTLGIAESRRERARGLIGATHVAPGRGLVLLRARSVHTFGMRFAIDAVLVDRSWRVVGVVTMRPGRMLLPRRGVRHVVEVAAGSGLRPGDRLSRALRPS